MTVPPKDSILACRRQEVWQSAPYHPPVMCNIIRSLASWPLPKARSCIWASNVSTHKGLIVPVSRAPVQKHLWPRHRKKSLSNFLVVQWLKNALVQTNQSINLFICLSIHLYLSFVLSSSFPFFSILCWNSAWKKMKCQTKTNILMIYWQIDSI